MFKKTFVRNIPANAIIVSPDKVKIQLNNGKWVERQVNAKGKMLDKSTIWYGKVKYPDGVVKTVPFNSDKASSQAQLVDLQRAIARGESGIALKPNKKGKELTLQELIDEWIEFKFRANVSDKTRKGSRFEVNKILTGVQCTTLKDLLSPSFAGRVDEYLDNLHKTGKNIILPNLNKYTLTQMRVILKVPFNRIKFLIDKFDIQTTKEENNQIITPESAQILVNWANNPPAALTLNKYKQRLIEFFRFLKKKKLIKDIPEFAPQFNDKKDRRKVRRAIPWLDCLKLCESVLEQNITRFNMTAKERAVLYKIAFVTLVRRRALKELKVSDCRLDADPPYISIRPETDKCEMARAIPLMMPDLVNDLKQILTGKSPNDLVWNLTSHTAIMLRKDIKAAELPIETPDGSWDFHAFRHSGATHYWSNSVCPSIIMKIGGWSSLEMLFKIYGHLSIGNIADVIKNAFK